MKYLLLQHWDGDIPPLVEKSIQSIQEYAKWCGADYKLLRGRPLFKEYTSNQPKSSAMQKVYMINSIYDEYDVVVMVDADIFHNKALTTTKQNIFVDETGCGVHLHVQDRLSQSLHNKKPGMFDTKYSYWGGSCYRFERDMRIILRSHLNEVDANLFADKAYYRDEGIMHYLANRSKIQGNYFQDRRWNYPSFLKDASDKGQLIHVRERIKDGSNIKTDKMENYYALHDMGVI